MTALSELEPIDIRPEISVLGVFKHLNYRPWFAIAEFVDNAIQSYHEHRDTLKSPGHNPFVLRIRIRVDSTGTGLIRIADNAAGIFGHEWPRALRPAEPPPDTTGLAEFGMGMKTAAAWFGRNLTIRSSALGEPFGRRIELNFQEIIDKRLQLVQPESFDADAQEHGTLIEISGLHKPLGGPTITKIKAHLGSIYRIFLREGSLKISFQSGNAPEEELEPPEVNILRAPRFDDLDGEEHLWTKPIDLDLGTGLRAHGYVAIRETGSTAKAGLALFRRNRLIVGSDDETYRPRAIFGASNSYQYQRIFGELTLEGFEVSHTKDGFRWEEYEEEFVDLLRHEINSEPLPLIRQAQGYRAESTRSTETNLAQEAQSAVQNTVALLDRELRHMQFDDAPPSDETPPSDLASTEHIYRSTRELVYRNQRWRVTAEVEDDPASFTEWFEYAIHTEPNADRDVTQVIQMRMSLRHPFSQRHVGAEYENLELLVRLATAMVVAEISARQAGVAQAGELRRRYNDLLRDVFSKP